MEIKHETIELDAGATIDDLFELFASRSMHDVDRDSNYFKVTKNAFYMGVNATMTILSQANNDQECRAKFVDIISAFEVYNATLHVGQ